MTLEANRAPIGGVLLDLQLPVMDGIQVLREIRLRSHHVPVVMMTANHDHTVREEALRLGVSHVFLKPFDTPRFVQMCEQIFPLTDGDT
jgi:CheY-like chemotaxis protein